MARNRRAAMGRISRVITDEIVLVSDVVMAIVAANIEASTSPTSPTGKNFCVSKTYDWLGSARFGSSSGAAHIGKNRKKGHTRYNAPESSAELRALVAEGAPMYRAARFHVPPL